MNKEDLLERITINPKMMVGKTVIRGTRLTVEYILGLLAHDSTMEEIMVEYPGLVKDDIYAGLLFASNNPSRCLIRPHQCRLDAFSG